LISRTPPAFAGGVFIFQGGSSKTADSLGKHSTFNAQPSRNERIQRPWELNVECFGLFAATVFLKLP
jgi:hypothetical protein